MNAGEVLGITIEGNDVYWTDRGSGSIEHCSLGGCTTPDLVASARTNPHSIIADASFVYWTEPDQGQIMKCARAGCANAPVPFVDGLGAPYALAIDDQNLYWTDKHNVVMKMAK
jgi:hypothetical protein